jgi:hypothetical protein
LGRAVSEGQRSRERGASSNGSLQRLSPTALTLAASSIASSRARCSRRSRLPASPRRQRLPSVSECVSRQLERVRCSAVGVCYSAVRVPLTCRPGPPPSPRAPGRERERERAVREIRYREPFVRAVRESR